MVMYYSFSVLFILCREGVCGFCDQRPRFPSAGGMIAVAIIIIISSSSSSSIVRGSIIILLNINNRIFSAGSIRMGPKMHFGSQGTGVAAFCCSCCS